jgi:hypothetical protein
MRSLVRSCHPIYMARLILKQGCADFFSLFPEVCPDAGITASVAGTANATMITNRVTRFRYFICSPFFNARNNLF